MIKSLSELIQQKQNELMKARAECTALENSYLQLLQNQSQRSINPDWDLTYKPLTAIEATRRAQSLMKEIGNEAYGKGYLVKLRDLFIRYATIFHADSSGYLDLTQFRVLTTELDLISKIPKFNSDIIYHAVNRRGLLDFWKFTNVMSWVAIETFPSLYPSQALEVLALELTIPEHRMDTIDYNSHVWRQSLRNNQKIIGKYRKLLKESFATYSVQKGNEICLSEVLKFCNNSRVVPTLVSAWEVSRIFRTVQHPQNFSETLFYREFEEAIVLLGIYHSNKEGVTSSDTALQSFLVFIYDNPVFLRVKRFDNSNSN